MKPSLTNYYIISQLSKGSNINVYRAQRQSDSQIVVLKMLESRYPSSQQISCLKHEFDLLHDLDLKGVITAYNLEYDDPYHFIVLEDFGGNSLAQLQLRTPMETADFINLALKISEALGQLHQRQIIHKDINPANILFNPQTRQVKLIDFDLATKLTTNQHTFTNPYVVEGTLAYVSPEQTGRMNRRLDYRSDFYSLGVTYYELLTGQLPFTATDPAETVHSHIARNPVSPSELHPSLPTAVANIILKLMAKSAEDRYQTVVGLQADLQTCLDQLETQGAITNFELGQQDYSGQPRFSQKLIGRQAEVALLIDAFADACTGPAKWVCITGHSGVGKSSLVREVYQSVTTKQGIFIEGKFDLLQRNIPYYGWQQALSQFVAYLLTEPEERTAVWRDKILGAVGNNGEVLTTIIPNLFLLLGALPTVPSLEAVESLNRLTATFARFIRAIATPEHPICLFLDDLQWADTASLTLLQGLLQDCLPHILVIVAYRDNEVDASHTLQRMLQELQTSRIEHHTVHLQNLSVGQVNELITDALGGASETADLAAIVQQKTEGNAFFVKAFLQALYEKKLLQFKPTGGTSGWSWSLPDIRQLSSTNNVIDLLADKIQTLPSQTQAYLKLAACISTQFELVLLATIAEATPQQVDQSLEPALLANILLTVPVSEMEEPAQTVFQFAHDRIHQAVYCLITDEERVQLHWRIGNLLWDTFSPRQRAERPFTILNQWHAALDLLEDEGDKIRFAKLSLMAGRKAKADSAFSSAYTYLRVASQLLQTAEPYYWHTKYDLMLSLATETAETAYLCSDFAEVERLLTIIRNQAHSLPEAIPAMETGIQAFIVQNKLSKAIDSSLATLRQLGIDVSENPSPHQIEAERCQMQQMLGSEQHIKALSDLLTMTDNRAQMAMRICMNALMPAYIVNSALYQQILLKMIDLSFKYGHSHHSIYAYLLYGGLLTNGTVDDIAMGYQFGHLALTLLEQAETPQLKGKVHHQYNNLIRHWNTHLNETLPALIDAHYASFEIGDHDHACADIATYLYHSFYAGHELGMIVQEMEGYYETVVKVNHRGILERLNLFLQVISNLQTPSSDPSQLIGDYYDERERVIVNEQADDTSMLFTHYLCKLILSYLFPVSEGDSPYMTAVKMADRAESYLPPVPAGMFHTAVFYFYDALVRLAHYPYLPPTEQLHVQTQVTAYQSQLENWAFHAPMNFKHKWHLIEAEKCRVLAQLAEAREHYDQAIYWAQDHNYVQEAALAYELAGRFYLDRGQGDLAEFYLRKGSRAYEQWGAATKVQQLVTLYPQFFRPNIQSQTKDSGAYLLDMSSLLKASQALSQEVELSRLLERLMKIVMENAGADRGILLLATEGQWLVQAETAVNQTTNLLQAKALETCTDLMATAVIHYVRQTQENIVLDDAAQADLFRHDPYIISQQPKSLLCLPLRHQGQLEGILYLENNLSTQAFTAERVEILNTLLVQAVISLENASLYSSLIEEIAERKEVEVTLRESEIRYRALFEKSNDAVLISNLTGRILAVNRLAVEMLGYSHTELVGMPMINIIDSIEQVDSYDKLSSILKGETLPIYERQFRKKNGTIFPVEINVALVHDNEGQPLHIQSVVRDISERKQIEAQVLASLHEKEVMLKEIHHRVKNNLQVISSLLDLQAGYVAEAEVQKMFQESRSRVRSMALVHEQLYQAADLARIDFADYVERLMGFLFRSYGRYAGPVDLKLDIAPVQLSVETAIPLGLIINELASNAYKHAFPPGKGGELLLQLHPIHEDKYCLTVQDNGMGLPSEIDIYRSPSLGLTIVMTLIDQLAAEIRLSHQEGTRFDITMVLATKEDTLELALDGVDGE